MRTGFAVVIGLEAQVGAVGLHGVEDLLAEGEPQRLGARAVAPLQGHLARLAQAEIHRHEVTLGTLINLHRIEDPDFHDLYARMDRLRSAIGARGAEIDRLVKVFEGMKAKDAARIFDRLDLKILVEVVTQINPRKMSEVLAAMAPERAEKLTVALATMARSPGVERVAVFVKGVGSGRDSAVRSLGTKGLEISSLTDLTPIPHNGPRPPKVRRV